MIKNISIYLISRFFMYAGLVCIAFSFYNIWGRSLVPKEFYKEIAAQGRIPHEDVMLASLIIAGLFLYSIGININGEST